MHAIEGAGVLVEALAEGGLLLRGDGHGPAPAAGSGPKTPRGSKAARSRSEIRSAGSEALPGARRPRRPGGAASTRPTPPVRWAMAARRSRTFPAAAASV